MFTHGHHQEQFEVKYFASTSTGFGGSQESNLRCETNYVPYYDSTFLHMLLHKVLYTSNIPTDTHFDK